MSSQLYVLHAHEESHLRSMTEALDEVLTELGVLHDAGRLAEEAGPVVSGGGFTRLA